MGRVDGLYSMTSWMYSLGNYLTFANHNFLTCKIEAKPPISECNFQSEKHHPCKRPNSVIGAVGVNIPFVPVTHTATNTASM